MVDRSAAFVAACAASSRAPPPWTQAHRGRQSRAAVAPDIAFTSVFSKGEIMRKFLMIAALAATALTAATPAAAQSNGRRAQERGQAQIPHCVRPLGALSVIEPDQNWWGQHGLESPTSIIRLFVARSGCFTLVDRGRGLRSRNLERELAEQGELQPGSNIGRGQVRAADYIMVPDLVTANGNGSGVNVGGILGAFGNRLGGRGLGAVLGGLSVERREANVMLTLVNSRTTEQERLTEGYARRSDLSLGGGFGAGFLGGGFGAFGAGGYERTEMGQVVVLAYLDAYIDMVRQLGGLPSDPSAAAPPAQ
jgi:curli biogenesis system outer membrane secretion channel CsgG